MNINKITSGINFNGQLSMEKAIAVAKKYPKTYYVASGMSRDTFSGSLQSHIIHDVHRTTKGLRRNLSYNGENGDLLVNMRTYRNGSVYIQPKGKAKWIYANMDEQYHNIPEFKNREEFISFWKEMLSKVM